MSMPHYKILKFSFALASTSLFTLPCFAATETSDVQTENLAALESIQETMEKAYMQNADLDAARAGLRVQDENVSQANADWRPSLSVQGTQQIAQKYPIGHGGRAHGSQTQYTARIAQNVYKGGKTEATIGQQESLVLQGRADLFDTEQTTLQTAIQVHTEILKNEAIVNYRKQNEEAYKKIQEFAQARFEVGIGSRTDVEAAKGDYESAKALLDRALGDLDIAKAAYTRQIGSSPENLAAANVIVPLPSKYEHVLEIAKAHNPTILKARYALEAAQYNVDIQLAGLLPTVDVEGTVGNNRGVNSFSSGGVNPSKSTNLGFQTLVNVPIYSQGIPNSQIRQAYQQVAQQKVNLVGAQRVVVEAARAAWDTLIAARESLKGFLAAVKAQELAVEGAYEEVSVGTKTIIDVLQIEERLIQAQIDLATAQQTLIVAGYGVLQAMGRLTARDLRLNVKYYDPDVYYNEYKDAWIQFWQGKDWRYVKDGDY
ncbi:MAG: TolC family outer membrane protein [Alphaproteobacteria bacterium]|nr:TolC family outer membrane protein [Alphaproteobacteria bacterium]